MEFPEELWEEVSPADIRAKLDLKLIKVPTGRSSTAKVFRAQKGLTIGGVLLDVLEKKVRSEAREFLSDVSVGEVFTGITKNAMDSWVVIECEVSDCVGHGSEWDLMAFAIDGRGYLYYQPGDTENEEEIFLRIVGAWEPIQDADAFRLCLLNTYNREWERCLLPPCMNAQFVTGPADIMLDAVSTVLKNNPGYWGVVSAKLLDLARSELSFEELVEGTKDQVNMPPEVVASILRPYVKTAGTEERIQPERPTERESRVLVAAFLHVIGVTV